METNSLQNFAILRVAIIFDNRLRSDTTGTYCRRALGQLCIVEHFLPAELHRKDAQGFDLYLYIDDGLEDDITLSPSVFWAIDTHLGFDRCLKKAWQADFVFCAQQDAVRMFEEKGVSATWLPLACDPDLHRNHELPKEYDLVFVGHPLPGRRADLLAMLTEKYSAHFFGNAYRDHLAKAYSRAKIAFNCSIKEDLNMRVFEAMACGTLLLTNRLHDESDSLSKLFTEQEHLLLYDSEEELLEQIEWALTHEAEREQIAAAGQRMVYAQHTYLHRMQQILETVFGGTEDSSSASHLNFLAKEESYFEHARPEVLKLVPMTAQRVLDIGCGSGRLGESLKQRESLGQRESLKHRQSVHVTGVEREENIASLARSRLDEVITGNIESDDISFDDHSFDSIICADVLEHLRHPDLLLKRITKWLTPTGTLIASLPNIQHHSVITSLLEGDFTYESAGLLDEDHLRFFTRREIERLFFRTGFDLQSWQVVPGPGHAEWKRGEKRDQVNIHGLQINGLPEEKAERFFAYQYLLTATPAPQTNFGLTSIIILTHNHCDITKACLESIRERTLEPYELIVIDNGSMDETTSYLASQPDVRLIRNLQNRGFPAGCNQGLRIAQGENLLLLNNDTIVTEGWLRRLLRSLHASDEIGLVGPCSNRISGAQQIPVGYHDLSGLERFAWDHAQSHQEETSETERLVGFCLLFKRKLMNKIGFLDERFGIGNFEDDDYCRRAIEAGYRALIVKDSFVHHWGSQTFQSMNINRREMLIENQERYEEKWNPPKETGSPSVSHTNSETNSITNSSSDSSSHAGTESQSVSLCMIVRDNEETIRPALESVRPWVDEMIVIDTGSEDRTPEIAAECGAKVSSFTWCDDFSAARNESLRHATKKWIFWMDSDDTLPEECGRKLRELLQRSYPEHVMGFVMQVHCPGEKQTEDVTVVDHVKLFRNRDELQFEGRIHEQILSSIRRVNGEVAWSDIYVVHSGSDHSPEGRKRKLERDFRILKKDLEERPNHPFVLFNMGMTHADAKQYDEAVYYLKRCLDVSDPEESHVRKAYALLIQSVQQTTGDDEAWNVCKSALDLFPEDIELLFLAGNLHQNARRYSAAVRCYKQLLNSSSQRHFASRDRSLEGHKALHNLALAHEGLSEWKNAEACWREAIRLQSNFRPAWLGLLNLYLAQHRMNDAERLTEEAALGDQRGLSLLLQARILESQHQFEEAIELLQELLNVSANDVELYDDLARLLFQTGRMIEAKPMLESLKEWQPENATHFYHLGCIYMELNEMNESASMFQRALNLRPNYDLARSRLDEIHCETGNESNIEETVQA